MTQKLFTSTAQERSPEYGDVLHQLRKGHLRRLWCGCFRCFRICLQYRIAFTHQWMSLTCASLLRKGRPNPKSIDCRKLTGFGLWGRRWLWGCWTDTLYHMSCDTSRLSRRMCDDTQNEGLHVYAFLDDLLDKLKWGWLKILKIIFKLQNYYLKRNLKIW